MENNLKVITNFFIELLISMGTCLNSANKNKKAVYTSITIHNTRSISFISVFPSEVKILRLIYKDLAERIEIRKINLENFLLFFHKNGYWGERLFK